MGYGPDKVIYRKDQIKQVLKDAYDRNGINYNDSYLETMASIMEPWTDSQIANHMPLPPKGSVVMGVTQIQDSFDVEYKLDLNLKNIPISFKVGVDCSNHSFKEYHGFTESYKYCVNCDHKESL